VIQWRLTSFQYEALIFANNRDVLPYPTYHLHPTTDPDDLARRRREAIDTLLPRVDDDLATLFRMLVSPAVRIHAHGRTGPDLRTELRAYAGMNNGFAGVVVQQPDPDESVSGDVIATFCEPRDVAELIVDSLPECEAGQLELIAVPRTDLAAEATSYSGIPLDRPPTYTERLSALADNKKTSWGEILVYPGPFIDNRVSDDLIGFMWVDYADNGRYFVRNDDDIVVRPMNRERFVATINSYGRRTHRRMLDS
jgi:hypothetical protein